MLSRCVSMIAHFAALPRHTKLRKFNLWSGKAPVCPTYRARWRKTRYVISWSYMCSRLTRGRTGRKPHLQMRPCVAESIRECRVGGRARPRGRSTVRRGTSASNLIRRTVWQIKTNHRVSGAEWQSRVRAAGRGRFDVAGSAQLVRHVHTGESNANTTQTLRLNLYPSRHSRTCTPDWHFWSADWRQRLLEILLITKHIRLYTSHMIRTQRKPQRCAIFMR